MLSPVAPYRGRFAPTPSGPLHFGSLIAAVGSYLQARASDGKWLVRIDDLDPPRSILGADTLILRALERYGLQWDEPVHYQSQHSERYCDILTQLGQRQRTYFCQCTRKKIQAEGGIYRGDCRYRALTERNHALRLKVTEPLLEFHDLLQGQVKIDPALAHEDFILRRRDGLFAYNLAVVVDDYDAHINQVVRGADLLETTARQLQLYRLLNWPEPSYLHLPLALEADGRKLSKQNHAPALDLNNPNPLLHKALDFLGLNPPAELVSYDVEQQLRWAISSWDINTLPHQSQRLSHA